MLPFLAWLGEQDVRSFDDSDVGLVRSYRAASIAGPPRKRPAASTTAPLPRLT